METSKPRCFVFGVVGCGLKVLSPAKGIFSGKNGATNLALLVLLMLKSNCVNELKVSDVDSSPGAARLGTRVRVKRYSKDCRKKRRSRATGPLKVTRGRNESIGPVNMLRKAGKKRPTVTVD